MTKLAELKGGGKQPLFLIHPGLAGAEVYTEMALIFAENDKGVISNIYGLESYNLNKLDTPVCDLKKLATQYLKEIKLIQPDGPYFFCGWS